MSENQRANFISKSKITSFPLNLGSGGSSASRAKFGELVERIEFMSNIVSIVALISFLGMMVPAPLVTVANYFMCDLDDKSFHLPCPML